MLVQKMKLLLAQRRGQRLYELIAETDALSGSRSHPRCRRVVVANVPAPFVQALRATR